MTIPDHTLVVDGSAYPSVRCPGVTPACAEWAACAECRANPNPLADPAIEVQPIHGQEHRWGTEGEWELPTDECSIVLYADATGVTFVEPVEVPVAVSWGGEGVPLVRPSEPVGYIVAEVLPSGRWLMGGMSQTLDAARGELARLRERDRLWTDPDNPLPPSDYRIGAVTEVDDD